MLIAAMNEDDLATIGSLLAATDEINTPGDSGYSEATSKTTDICWEESSPLSSTSRQIGINESPKGVIQRLMPPSGTIYFGMDIDSFTRANIDPGVANVIKDAAIKAANDFTEQNMGIAFAYDPNRRVFNIRYDPGLDRNTLAEAFFPSDSPERWQVRVSSTANNRWVFENNRKSLRNAFDHEFAQILGLRHHDAGSNLEELSDPSVLWPGTDDRDCNTIMRTGVISSRLRIFAEDFRVIREFYSKENGALVGGVQIVDVDPYEKLLAFFCDRGCRFLSLNRRRK